MMYGKEAEEGQRSNGNSYYFTNPGIINGSGSAGGNLNNISYGSNA